MWNKTVMAFGLGAAAAGGLLMVTRATQNPDPAPPVIVVQTPPPPPAAYVPSIPLPKTDAVAQRTPRVQSNAPAAVAVIPAARPKPASTPPRVQAPQNASPAPAVPAGDTRARPMTVAEMPAQAPPVDPPSVLRQPVPAPPGMTETAQAEPAAAQPPKGPKTPRSVTVPAGTMITVRLQDTVSSGKDSKDDPFNMTLDAPLIVNGLALAERGALQKGRIVELVRAGRMGQKAKVALELTQLTLSDGQTVDVKTDTFVHQGQAGEKSGATRRAILLAGIGAAIGSMAGGGKGALIGAGAGAAGGAGSVIFTKGTEATLSSETRLTFRLKEPVTLTERIQ